MRLGTLATGEGTVAAVIRDDGAVRLGEFADVGELLRAGPRACDALEDAAETEVEAYDPSHLRRPVLAPGAVVCVGLNYRSHIREMGRDFPEHPTLFSKLPRALADPYAEVDLPPEVGDVDYEGELAIVIGVPGRFIPAARALRHVAGLTVANDVTSRTLQRRTIQWFAGKTLQSATPVGPVVVSLNELGDLDELELRVTVNGELRQRGVLGDLLFGIPELIADLSRIVQLEPGDLILTGTPGGVGEADGRFVRDGDCVETSIDGIGALRTTFRRGSG